MPTITDSEERKILSVKIGKPYNVREFKRADPTDLKKVDHTSRNELLLAIVNSNYAGTVTLSSGEKFLIERLSVTDNGKRVFLKQTKLHTKYSRGRVSLVPVVSRYVEIMRSDKPDVVFSDSDFPVLGGGSGSGNCQHRVVDRVTKKLRQCRKSATKEGSYCAQHRTQSGGKSRKEFTVDQTLTIRFAVHNDDPIDWLFSNAVLGQEFPDYDDADEAPLWVRAAVFAISMLRDDDDEWLTRSYMKIGRDVPDEVQNAYDARNLVSLATEVMNDMTLAELHHIGV